MKSISRTRFLAGYLAILFLLSAPAFGFNFTPTDPEFNSWPGYCRAVYVYRTNVGARSRFVNQVAPREREELRTREDSGIYGPHHSCAGMIWLNRARQEGDDDSRIWKLTQAMGETQFTYQRSNSKSFFFGELAAQKATIHFELGEKNAAIDTLRAAIRDLPSNPIPYSALAIIQRKMGQLAEAKNTLLAGDDAVDGKSPEIKYNLGLIALEMGEPEEALTFAEAAYRAGYPLPGLRVKLRRAGYELPQ